MKPIKERFERFIAGERPNVIPYTIYWSEYQGYIDNKIWKRLANKGLGITVASSVYHAQTKNIEKKYDTYSKDRKNIQRYTTITPVGEIYEELTNGWHSKMLLETAEDYKVMTYITKNTSHIPAYDFYKNWAMGLEEHVLPSAGIGRTPLQTILVDYVGLENFAYHIFDFEEEMQELYEEMNKGFKQKSEIVAGGPAKWVYCLENFTAETLGPDRYKNFLMNVYDDSFKMIRDSGKYISVHYDGRLDSCKELVGKGCFDIIESLTEPPEGDMMLDQCRATWPDKRFMININVGLYSLPKKQFKEQIYRLVETASPDKTKIAFEISEHIPPNFETSIETVLETLAEIG